jgi:preprotein translocase subunit SecF
MAFGNIYESKNYKLLALVPIALLLISLYFVQQIPLDSSLKGGINLQLQTNSVVDTRVLTTAINSHISGAQASVSTAPGGISVTIATNSSLSTAQNLLVSVYGAYSNYTTAQARTATLQSILAQPNQTGNQTIAAEISAAQRNQTISLGQMSNYTSEMLSVLKPLTSKTYQYNSSNPSSIISAAKEAQANASQNYESYILSIMKSIVPYTSYSYNEVTPTLGAFFLSQIVSIILISFIIIALAVFVIFRTPVPSFSVVFGAGNDIIVALGMMGLFGIPLGVASVGGLLMLIGYSIDTDMLSAIRIIKRGEGTPSERAFSTMKTGLTMTFAAIISFSILLIVSYLAFIPTYFEISSVVLFGLIADIFTTWFGNTVMVLWYKQRKDTRLHS